MKKSSEFEYSEFKRLSFIDDLKYNLTLLKVLNECSVEVSKYLKFDVGNIKK